MFTSYQKRPRLQTFWNFSASSIIHIINKRRQKNTHLHCSLLFESFLVYIILPWEMKSVIFKRFSQANPSLYSFVTCNDIQIFLKKLFDIYLSFCRKWMKINKSSRSIKLQLIYLEFMNIINISDLNRKATLWFKANHFKSILYVFYPLWNMTFHISIGSKVLS